MTDDYSFEISFFESVLAYDPYDDTVMEMLANFYTKAGRLDEGLEADRKIADRNPDKPIAHYNLACSLALKGLLDEALSALKTAIEKGYDDFKWMLEDPDLKNLRHQEAFQDLLREWSIIVPF